MHGWNETIKTNWDNKMKKLKQKENELSMSTWKCVNTGESILIWAAFK